MSRGSQPRAVQELSVAVDRRTAAWEAEVLDRVRARVVPTSWAAFCQRMIERRPAAAVAAELGLSSARFTRRKNAPSGW